VGVGVDRNEPDLRQDRRENLNSIGHQIPPSNNHHQPPQENHHSLSVSDPSNPSSPTKQSASSSTATQNHSNGSVIAKENIGDHHHHHNDNEAELNFEYLRNTLLQFLEHKEMRVCTSFSSFFFFCIWKGNGCVGGVY
jgi:hypothetical protein